MIYTPPEGVTIGSFTARTLPASFSAPADAVVTYKIYGTSEGAGVETESGEPAGYKIPLTVESGVTENYFDKDAETTSAGDSEKYTITGLVPGAEYTVSTNFVQTDEVASIYYNNGASALGFVDLEHPRTSIADSNGQVWIAIRYRSDGAAPAIYDKVLSGEIWIMLTKGSTPPDHYIPHRYESNYDLFIGDSKLSEDEYVDFTTQKIYKLQEGELTPTDPPLPLPSIITYDGANTITSTETLGDVEFTGVWTAIMGSTEDESIDIDFTVDAEEYIAFVTVDDGPSIQVSDTITMPSSAGSFTLEVVAWGRERYTDTVYNALS